MKVTIVKLLVIHRKKLLDYATKVRSLKYQCSFVDVQFSLFLFVF